MPSLIDWSAINPLPAQPSPALASIPEMLQQFAQRRQQAAHEAAARQQAEAHFRAQMEEKKADDLRAEQWHKAELDYQNRTLHATEEQRKTATAEQQRKDAAEAYPKIQQAYITDPLQARNLAALHGGAIEDKPQAPAPAPPPPVWGLPRELGLAMNMGTGDLPQAPMPAQPPPGQQLRLAGRVLDLASPQEMEASRMAAAKQQVERLRAGMGPAASDRFGQQALEEAAGLVAAGSKEDPAAAVQRRRHELEQEAITQRGQELAAAGRASGEGHKEVTANLSALRGFRADVSNWKKEAGVRELGKAYEEMDKAHALAKSGSGPAQAAAVESFIKSARGGAVTGASQKFMTEHMGGLLAGLEGLVTNAKNGRYSPQQMAALNKGIADAKTAIKQAVEERRQEFVDKYYSGAYDDMKADVDNEYAGSFGHFGYKVERKPGTKGISATGKSFTAPAPGPKTGLSAEDEDRLKRAGF